MAGEQSLSERAKGILDERMRAIEQVKRLYSVVMGFAITQMIANLYVVAQTPGFDGWAEFPFLIAQGLCFASLISLFYLGAERMLEKRYLQSDSPVPRRRDLLMDYMTLAIQAFMFVMLSNTVPDLHGPVPRGFASLTDWRIGLEQQYQLTFVYILMVMTVLDCAFLLIQLYRLRDTSEPGRTMRSRVWSGVRSYHSLWHKTASNVISAHRIWLSLNMATIIAMVFAVLFSKSSFAFAGLTVNGLSALILLTYGTRFGLDFGLTFRFYYPPDPLPP